MNQIILASSSKRRKDILEKYNVNFKVIKSDIGEPFGKDDNPEELAMSLAFRKAYSVAKDNSDSIIIGADTVVYYKNEVFGKPKDEEDVKRMLNILNGKTHEVVTGISVINLKENKKIIDFEKTKVVFRELDENIINNYIKTGEPFGKAGSYAIQDIGALFVESIEGSYLNVVGLPLVKLDKLLNKHFDISITNMIK